MIDKEVSEIEWKEFLNKKMHGGISKIFKRKVEEEAGKLKLPEGISFQEKLFMLRNGIREIPKCVLCNASVKFQASTTSYMTYCSQSCSAKSKQTQEKKRATNIVKYGISNIANVNKKDRAKAVFESRYDQLSTIKHKVLPLFSKSDWKGGLSSTQYPWKCVRCNTEYHSKLDKGFPPCPKCEKSFTNVERIIKNILDKYKVDYQAHNRRIIGHANMEVDFYIPLCRVGIEVHGLWYHTEKYFSSNYHQRKANICLEKDIKLLQIFSDEIEQKLDIVESKIKRALHIRPSGVIGARKCVIKKISGREARDFLDQNHLQGKDNSTVKYGAWLDAVLMGVVTFCKPRRALGHKNIQEGVWELARFCTLKDKSCPGLFSKMLKVFIEENRPKQIISYGDYRWTHPHNNVYCKSGFVYKGTSKPNYFYLKNGKRLHRFGFRKSLLIKTRPELSHLTEKQITEEMGLHRVWDAGHHRFELVL